MATRDELIAYARQQAAAHGVDPDIFVRQIDVESGFNPDALSPAGASGIAQIVPRWHPGVDVWNPWDSLAYAARLMRSHLDAYGGSYELALAAYNAGPGNVAKYGGVPPFEETQRYLRLILGTLTLPPVGTPRGRDEPPPSGGAPAPGVLEAVRRVPWQAFTVLALMLLGLRWIQR